MALPAKKRVGRFEIEATQPHPVWITIRSDGDKEIHGLQLEDLRDLQYALGRMIDEIETSESR